MTLSPTSLERLLRLNRVWLSLFLAIGVFTGFCWVGSAALHEQQRLNLVWRDDGTLSFYSTSDGPFIVTHLLTTAQTEGDKTVAALPHPVAIIDSGGAVFTSQDLKRLVWRDIYGYQRPAPRDKSRVKALYFQPLQAVSPGGRG